jgi:glycosyltransferase involved in cell wall biosynthesis
MSLSVVLFSAAILFVLYVLAGYPGLLALLARRRGPGFEPVPQTRPVSVLIAVRNGAAFLTAKLESLLAQDYDLSQVEIVVVSDGSTDQTEAITLGYRERGVHLLRVPAAGKALALNAALAHLRGEIVVLTDVRQRLAPDCLRLLTAGFHSPAVGVVSGDVVIVDETTRAEADIGLYRRYETWIRANMSRLDSMLGATGCLYAIRRELLVPYPPNLILDDMFQPMQVLLRGFRVVLEARARAYDFPVALEMEFVRKVRTQAGVYQLLREMPAILTSRNRMWWHFLSLKLGRLLLPHGLLVALVASPFLPWPYRLPVLAAEVFTVALALADPLLGERSAAKRISSPLHTFLVLVAAAFCAQMIWFVPPERLWKTTRVRNLQQQASAGDSPTDD